MSVAQFIKILSFVDAKLFGNYIKNETKDFKKIINDVKTEEEHGIVLDVDKLIIYFNINLNNNIDLIYKNIIYQATVLVCDHYIYVNKIDVGTLFDGDLTPFYKCMLNTILPHIIDDEANNEIPQTQHPVEFEINEIDNGDIANKIRDIINDITLSSSTSEGKKYNGIKFYKNYRNDCYVNSLLCILLNYPFPGGSIFMNKIINEDTKSIQYNKNMICSKDSNIYKSGDINKYADDVRDNLIKLYDDNKRVLKSCPLITLLGQCDTEIQPGEFMNPLNVYSVLCNLYEGLQINAILTNLNSPSNEINYRKYAVFGFDDVYKMVNTFTDTKDAYGNDIVTIDVVDINNKPSDIISFFNGGTLVNTNWLEIGFDTTINIKNKKYELFGVIMHVQKLHYISFVKLLTNKGEVWCMYDDSQNDGYILPLSDKLEDLRRLFFIDNDDTQPSMYFYTHIYTKNE